LIIFYSFRRKFNARINEVQEQLTEVLAKASNLEKIKQRLQSELDALSGEVEKVKKNIFEFIDIGKFDC
jgi:peptidoglycan hydrolase CwlO-like protein